MFWSLSQTEKIWTCTEEVQLRLELPGRMPRGRPKRRCIDVVNIRLVGVTEAQGRVRWRQMISCGNP